jgi:lysophospholipase L1-like esterase
VEQSSSIFSFKLLRTPVIIVSIYILLEIVFRIYTFGIHTSLNWHKYNPQGILMSNMAMAVEDPDVSWKLKPNVQGLLKTKPFTTNSLGLRNPEIAMSATEGTIRIACLGRSITMGSGVGDDETYAHVLQEYFDHWKPDTVEVINCGVGGQSFKQMLDYYETYISPLNPDIILIPMSPRDMANGEFRVPPPLSAAKTSLTNLKYYLSFTFSYNIMKTIVKRVTENIMSVDWKERVADIDKPKAEPMNSESLLTEFITKRNNEGVMCYFFSPDRHAKKRVHDTGDIKKFLGQFESADYLSIDNYVAEKIPKIKYIYFSDTHPSPEMHAVLAGALFQELKPRVGLIEK